MAGASRSVLTRALGAFRWRLVKNRAPTPFGAFCLALIIRLAWVTFVADPILYAHPYQYFSNGLWIAESDDPLRIVLHYDNWRVQYDRWTAAPLYYLFLSAIFRIFGSRLDVVFWIQCVLGSVSAALVTALGARLGGKNGRHAGWLYAVYLPAVQVCGTTLTEALHTPLVLIAFEGILRGRASAPRHFVAGLIHGFAALTRSVSSGFFAVLALHRSMTLGLRRAIVPVAALALGGSLAILPWTARNVYFLDEPVLIETFAFENLWFSNVFVGPGFKEQQRQDIVSRPTLGEQREAAVAWTWRNLRRNPGRILPKSVDNLEHLLRPDGLHRWAGARATLASWRHAIAIAFDDGPWLLGWMGLLGYLLWGRRGSARNLALLWLGYSLLMLVVIFQNEVRYRSLLAPFLLAATMSAMTRGTRAGRWAAGLTSAVVMSFLGVGSLVSAAGQLAAGRPFSDEATRKKEAAIARGFENMREGRLQEATEDLKDIGRDVEDVRGPMAQAWLSANMRNSDSSAAAAAEFHNAEWEIDPTQLQEAAFEMLPPPRTDRVEVGGRDVGAIRGFSYPWPRSPQASPPIWRAAEPEDPTPHRWTRPRSWIRLRPSFSGPAQLTLRMGAPEPYRGPAQTVRVSAGRNSREVQVGGGMMEYTLEVTIEGPELRVRIDSTPWNRSNQPADQGVRVDWLSVKPRK